VARSDYRKGALPYHFVVIPKDVLRSAEWQRLIPSARVLVFDLMAQYTGTNNGRLCPSWKVMQRCGWKSENTLIPAKRALLDCSFAVLTRQGHAPRTADWIGLTWWKLDWERSMDIGPRDFPYLNFIKVAPTDPNTGRAELKTHGALQELQDKARKGPLRPAITAVMPPHSTPQ
jgi:hypothetical protein